MLSYIRPAQTLIGLLAGALLASCATVPEQKYLARDALSAVRRVAVITTASDITVSHSREETMTWPWELLLGPAGFLLWAPVEWGVRSTIDSAHTSALRSTQPAMTIAQQLSDRFINTLLDSGLFQSVDPVPADLSSAQSNDRLRSVDALIRLQIDEVSLKAVASGQLSLFLSLSAEMVSLPEARPRAILWSRREQMQDGGSRTLDFYKSHGIPALDAFLEKLARRLADDIIYSR
jgi:hypothetical protein